MKYICLVLILLLIGCNDSIDKSAGGYSWWSGPYISATDEPDESYYMTGVYEKDNLSYQWVAKVDVDDKNQLSISKKRVIFNEFTGDEHNALAVVSHNGNIVIALTGHAEKKDNLMDRIYIYQGKTIDSLTQIEIGTIGPPSYVQLVSVENDIILFSRIGLIGLSYMTSSDNGKTWSDWKKIMPRSLYAKVEYNKVRAELDFYIGVHPTANQQYIKTIRAIYDGNSIKSYKEDAYLESGSIKSSKLDIIKEFPKEKSARILSHYSGDSKLVLYAEHLKPGSNNLTKDWQLNIAIQRDTSVPWKIFTLKESITGVLGSRASALNVGYYVYGGDIEYLGNNLVSIFYAEKNDGVYRISEIVYDFQFNNIIEEKVIVESEHELYRPLIFNSKFDRRLLMYNEASSWENYFSWRSKQIIKPLDELNL